MIILTIFGKAQPKARARRGKYGNWYTPATTREWEASIYMQAKTQMGSVKPTAGLVKLKISFYLAGKPRGDGDNLLKAIFDGLQGALYENDKQVCGFQCDFFYHDSMPRVTIEAEEDVKDGEGKRGCNTDNNE